MKTKENNKKSTGENKMLNAGKSRFSLGKTIFKLFLMIYIISLSANLTAGDKIKIKLHQPPPNRLEVGDLWKLDITNTTRENIKIYITGTATETKKDLIVSGKSKILSVSPGSKTYTYEDFKSGEVNWKDKSIQEVLFRTGNVPEGEYTICVTAFYENGEIADQESCIEQSVQQLGSITLISPGDGEEISLDQPIMFAWTPLPNGGPYSLRIVELKGDQSPDVAIKESRPILDKEGIKVTTYQYGLADPKLEADKEYAWQITSGGNSSPVYRLIIIGASGICGTTYTLTSPSNSCCYVFKINRGTLTGVTDVKIVSPSVQITSAINSNLSVTMNPAIVPMSTGQITWHYPSNIPSGNVQAGEICFAPTSMPLFTVQCKISLNNGFTWICLTNLTVSNTNCNINLGIGSNCLCASLLSNPNFIGGLVPGNMGSGGSVANWIVKHTSPRPVIKDIFGSCDKGFISLTGNHTFGGSFYQTGLTTITAGSTYQIKFNARYVNGLPLSFRFRAILGTGLINYINGGTPIGTVSVSNNLWTSYSITWTAPAGTYDGILINVENSSPFIQSTGEIDNICVTNVTPLCQCPATFGTWDNLIVQQGMNSTTLPNTYGGNHIQNYGTVNNFSSGTPISFTFSAHYTCNPNTCIPTYFWTLYNSNWQTIILQGTSTSPSITMPSSGAYNVSFHPICGGTKCSSDSSWVNLNIP